MMGLVVAELSGAQMLMPLLEMRRKRSGLKNGGSHGMNFRIERDLGNEVLA